MESDERVNSPPLEIRLGMNFVITRLSESDLQSVDDLSRRYRSTVGFFTTETFRDYLQKGGVLGALTDQGQLAGYLLSANYPDRFRIAQLCVLDEFRGQGIARRLFDALKASATTQKVIKLRCRRDFPAHEMWPKLGFISFDERPGRSTQGHLLTLWVYRLTQDDELGLWKAETSDEAIDIVIDAQIFYDFDATETSNSLISKGLLHDSLVDSLNLWITDEMFLEIGRNSCDETRKRSRERAHGMAQLHYHQDQAEQYKAVLKGVLPYRSPSEQSDLHHIAKTAASAFKTFVTKDEKLIKKAQEIKSLTGVSVINPAEVIISLHEISEKHSYAPARVSGLNLHWSRMRDENCAGLPNQCFQKEGESRGKLIETIRSFLAYPKRYKCDILLSQSHMAAIRVLETTQEGTLLVHLARVSVAPDSRIFGDFLIADTLSLSVEGNNTAVVFSGEGAMEYLNPSLIEMGFKPYRNGWAKIALAEVANRDDVQARISGISPDLGSQYQELNDLDFERSCAPILSNGSIPAYIIPIKPAFAMGLLDRNQAADDLFGGDPSVLLRWDNVYYRKNSHHKMLQAPGRILWYVSGSVGAIVAISHLDEIDIGLPKELFRKHRKFGILEWRDLYSMCGKNIDQKIMAIRFSRTFLFKDPIQLNAIRTILSQDGIGATFQSPLCIPFQTFKKVHQIGFRCKS